MDMFDPTGLNRMSHASFKVDSGTKAKMEDRTADKALVKFHSLPADQKVAVVGYVGLTTWVTSAITFLLASDNVGFGSTAKNALAIGGPLMVAAWRSFGKSHSTGTTDGRKSLLDHGILRAQ